MGHGIDFGTTNSYLARSLDQRTQVISGTVPSLVQTEEGDIFFSIKRYLGRRESELQEMGLDFISDDDGVRVPFAGLSYRPEELAARIFEKLSVPEAVLAVPAHYDDAQRRATTEAARLAGISVRRLVHEPTAAALALGKEEGRVLVFDLGGGTLDVSLLEREGDLLEVIQTSGDRSLGGDDLDILLATELAERMGVSWSREVLSAARELKHALSSSDSALATVSYDRPVYAEFSRQELLRVAEPFLERIRQALLPFRECAAEELVLVGGMSRMPAVRETVEDFFAMSAESIADPETAVARGAAVYAEALSSEGPLLLDITPMSLGVEVEGEGVSIVVPAGTTMPLREEKMFTTSYDNQLSVEVNIYQGEERLLGKMRLLGIPPSPAGLPEIWVTFEVDVDGILRVFATNPDSGAEEEITISERALLRSDGSAE